MDGPDRAQERLQARAPETELIREAQAGSRAAFDALVRQLRVVSDSELMVKQMKGQYKVASPALRPLWEEARQLAGQLERFEITHTLRGGNKDADRLANEAMDKGMGRPPAGPQGGPTGRQASGKKLDSPGATRLVLEGYVKDGVVHLLEGDLPEGTFVKVIKE